MATLFVALILLLAPSLGNPLNQHVMKVHESRSTVPPGFIYQGAASPDTVLRMRIALRQSNPDILEDVLMTVSTPGTPRYGQHLSKDEVEAFVAPSQDTVDAVGAFLTESGLNTTKLSPTGDWLGFQLTVGEANKLFDANFSVFKHQDTGTESIVTMAYSLPIELTEHILLLHPTISFDSAFQQPLGVSTPLAEAAPTTNLTANVAPPASCTNEITPTCLQDLYNIPTTSARSAGGGLGVSGFLNEFASKSDLSMFLTNFRPDINPNTTFSLQALDGGSNSQEPGEAGVEANLDTQIAVGMATGIPVTFISVGLNNTDGDLDGFLDFIHFLLSQEHIPRVLTTSYGQNEEDVSAALAQSLCNAYVQLGARGVSILFSSGDGGVAGGRSQDCTTFVPTFPSGCSFMTSVGATTNIPETAASFSSGGFSNVFPRPKYQAQAVSSYLSKIRNTDQGKFNTSGRAYPDVSTQGVNFGIFVDSQFGLVSGTSCSSPLFASMIALINGELVARGKSPLGFLNPFLYGPALGAGAFNDIMTGSNPGCDTQGFPAESGWDPVTGLGTPDFASLLSAAISVAGL